MDNIQKDLQEYKQLLQFLSAKTQKTQVLAPIDGEGREFWVHALADPQGEIELEVGEGKWKSFSSQEALKVVKSKIDSLEAKLQ